MQLMALPFLGGRMIHFENVQTRMRVAECESIEPGSKDNILTYAARKGTSQFIFRKAAAHGHEGTECLRERMVLFGIGSKGGLRLSADDAQRQRIFQYTRMIQKLMRGSANRH